MKHKILIRAALAVLVAALAVAPTFASVPGTTASLTRLERAVRHELVMLPWYNVFDDLGFRVDGGKVTLFGHVTRPTLKSDAERVVRRLEGVESVSNQIEVLPLSPFDDRIRLAVYRALYSQPALSRYRLGAVPSIHIIVKHGNVTLTGVVLNEGERNIANIVASGVSGVFSVKNDLQVERKKS